MIKNIIFDFDGVLVDSETIILKAFIKYMQESEIKTNEKEFANLVGKPTVEVIDILSKDFNLPFIIRIDWGCCLLNDNVCRDYFLNEIECAPTMGANDKIGLDFFARIGKEINKIK